MQNPLVIASVTAILKSMLEQERVTNNIPDLVGDVSISAVAPDHVDVGADEKGQLNVFFYQATPRTELSARGRQMLIEQRVVEQPRVGRFDLHYLLTAYGAHDLTIEVLLELALDVIERHKRLNREQMATFLNWYVEAQTDVALASRLQDFDLPNRYNELQLSPQFLTSEELSKLWSSLQARYRPSIMCKVSLLDREEPM